MKRKVKFEDNQLVIYESLPYKGFEEINLSSLRYYEDTIIKKFVDVNLEDILIDELVTEIDKMLLLDYI